jgi:hypothetical protein
MRNQGNQAIISATDVIKQTSEQMAEMNIDLIADQIADLRTDHKIGQKTDRAIDQITEQTAVPTTEQKADLIIGQITELNTDLITKQTTAQITLDKKHLELKIPPCHLAGGNLFYRGIMTFAQTGYYIIQHKTLLAKQFIVIALLNNSSVCSSPRLSLLL